MGICPHCGRRLLAGCLTCVKSDVEEQHRKVCAEIRRLKSLASDCGAFRSCASLIELEDRAERIENRLRSLEPVFIG